MDPAAGGAGGGRGRGLNAGRHRWPGSLLGGTGGVNIDSAGPRRCDCDNRVANPETVANARRATAPDAVAAGGPPVALDRPVLRATLALTHALVLAGCTAGAATRVEATIDRHRVIHVGGDLEASAGAGVAATAADGSFDVARDPEVVLAFFVGARWGEGHAWLTTGVDLLRLRPGDVGVTGGIHASFARHRCTRVVFGLGATGVIATHVMDRPDPSGPDPRIARVHHSLSLIAGFHECGPTPGELGLSYTAGATAVVLVPPT